MIERAILTRAIADITRAGRNTPAQSKESAANTLAMLMKAKRELYPPTAKQLAAISVEMGITPDDFAAAILQRSETE